MIGERLKQLRLEKQLSQTKVAKDLNVSQQTYNCYEHEKRSPDYKTLKELADYFNVSMAYLLGEIDVKNFSDLLPSIAATQATNKDRVSNSISKLTDLEKLLLEAYAQLDIQTRQKLINSMKTAFGAYAVKNKSSE